MSSNNAKQRRFRIDRLEERVATSVPGAFVFGLALGAASAGAALVYRLLPGDDNVARSARAFWRKWRPALEGLEDRTVPAPLLTLSPMPPSVPEGAAPIAFTLGTITDAQVATSGFLMAQVDWGDGTTANPDVQAATITQTGPHTFTVGGSHAYLDGGSYTATITVIDVYSFMNPTIQSTTINVTDPDLKVTAAPVQAAEGQAFSGTVATISDPGSTDVFTALVNWGDGTQSTVGTLAGSNGNFTVSGSHTYAEDGVYPVAVAVIESGVFKANLSGANQVPPTATAGSGTVTLVLHPNSTITVMGSVQSLTGSVTVAHLHNGPAGVNGPVATDANGANIDYTAAQTGTNVTFPAQTFTVNSALIQSLVAGNIYTNIHTTAFPGGEVRGQFNAITTESATGTSTATVSETDLTGGVDKFLLAHTNGLFPPGIAPVFKATTSEGQALTTNLAEVYDGLGSIPPNLASATINWGDGTTTTGMVTTPAIVGPLPFSGDIISGTHTYADEGVFPIAVTFSETDGNGNPLPGDTLTFTAIETVTDADTLAPAPGVTQPTVGTPAQPLMVGTAFSGPVGVFSDLGYPGQTRADLQATINWGDGSTGGGTITQDPTTGLFTVSGKHTYTTPGTFPVTVSLADDAEAVAENAPGIVHTTATISNGAATLVASPVLAAEGSQATLTATLTDPNAISAVTGLPNPPSAYTATVNWGDGTSSAGTVTGPNGGPYTITGTHVYAVDGNYTITAAVTEPGVLPVPLATATTTAAVADTGVAIAGTTPIAATEGTAITAPVATFVDAGAVQALNTVPGNGDANPYGLAIVPSGFPSTGVLQPGDILVANFNNAANVQGTGTTISRITAAGQTSTFFTSALPGLSTALGVLKAGFVIVGNVPNDGNGNVQPGSLQVLDTNGNVVNVPGLNGSLVTDPWDLTVVDQGSTAQVYVSNVSGTTGANGTVVRIDLSLNNGTITVADEVQIGSGYATRLDAAAFVVGPGGLAFDPMTHTLYVASQAEIVGGVEVGTIFAIPNADTATTSNGTGTVVYADPAHLHGPIGLVQLANGDLVVANSDAVNTDPNQPSELVEFTSAGQFVGQFSMDPANGGAFGIAIGTIGGLSKFIAVDDNAATVTVFNFVPTSPAVNDFTASINWGDGTTSAGTITYSGNGTISAAGGSFTVTGTHTYADEGNDPVTVSVQEAGVAQAFFTFLTAANQVPPMATPGFGVGQLILSADQTTLTFFSQFGGLTSNPTAVHLHNAAAGQNGPVALDANGNKIELVNLPSATTGAVGPQTFTITPAFVAQLLAGHIYENIHTLNNPNGEIRGQFTPGGLGTTTATVADADAFTNLAVVATPFVAGASTSQIVATFSDTGYPTQVAGDLTATINWGDGTPVNPDIATGTIAATGGGNFTITGGHAYATPGTYSVTVTVNDDAPGTATASATGTVTVQPADVLAATPVNTSLFEGAAPATVTVASFTDTNTATPASAFAATILWSDGVTTTGTVNGTAGNFTVAANRAFTSEATLSAKTTIAGPGGPATATSNVTVNEADAFVVTVTPPAGALPGAALTSVQVATFTDTGYPTNSADLAATINWGDTAATTGTIGGSNGNFTVAGSHTYAMAGTYTITVTVKDVDGTATASNSATITVTAPVVSPQQMLQNAYNALLPLKGTKGLTRNDTHNLNAAIGDLAAALNPALFVDGFHLQPKTGMTVFHETSDTVGYLGLIYNDPNSALPKATILNLINQILAADKTLAQTAITEATAAGGNKRELQTAAQEMRNAAIDLAQARTDWDGAANHYGNAWMHALHSIGKL